ncbi:MAG: hypothetical protein CMA31_02905 [Euryarchaeota archaeon]|nr:hypothetical protein [Euryarchaeota archaeon]|tara:strand:+ start:1024 stop:1266 length:243 start_codon:yes stop_codon:yes gene_type:complete
MLGYDKDEEKLEKAYRRFEKLSEELCKDGQHGPLEVAGVMMAQAMRIYKTALADDEFERLVETILESRHGITPFQKPTIN